MTAHQIDIQRASRKVPLPNVATQRSWIRHCLADAGVPAAELCIRIVADDEMQALNATWRERDYATNVLSFPADGSDEAGRQRLGDIVICEGVVAREASEQNKALEAHFAHLLVHGMLHLQGYDHVEEDQAEQMETLEIRLMRELGFDNPYTVVGETDPVTDNEGPT